MNDYEDEGWYWYGGLQEEIREAKKDQLTAKDENILAAIFAVLIVVGFIVWFVAESLK